MVVNDRMWLTVISDDKWKSITINNGKCDQQQ